MTNENRLILIHQFELLSKQNPDRVEEYSKNVQILKNGFPNEYDSIFSGLTPETSLTVIREVNDIITLFRNIRNTIDKLTAAEIEQNQELLEKIKFHGFDGNHDEHYFYFKHLVQRQDDFQDINDWPINSHNQGDLSRYRAMLKVLEEEEETASTYHWGLLSLKKVGDTL